MNCKYCGERLEKDAVVVQHITLATKEQIEEEQLGDIHVVTDNGDDLLFLVTKQNFFCDAEHAAEHLVGLIGQS